MKRLNLLLALIVLSTTSALAQLAFNPFTQNIHFVPEPTVAGFGCGTNQAVEFTMGMTTADSATLWQTQPLKVKVCIGGFTFNGANAASVVSGSYSSNFDWTFDPLNANCIIGTQNQTLYGTGTNPLFPDPRSSGDIKLELTVPATSPISTVLSVDVTLDIPTYMVMFNSTGDDPESTQTQTFCALSVEGTVYYDTVRNPNDIDKTNPLGNPSNSPLCANLVNAAGNVVATDVVANDGTYKFDNVAPSQTYEVVLSATCGTLGNPAPVPSLPLGWSNTAEDCCDGTGSDGNTNGKTTVTVGLVSVDEVNFGITQLVSLGNQVWNDINQNGSKESAELGIPGANVKLYEDANMDNIPDGAAIDSVTTPASGLYLFDDLEPGSYIVGVTPPLPSSGPNYKSTDGAGEEANPNTNGDNNDNGVTLVGAETRSNHITLSTGNEPSGETPNNNTTKTDTNSNLTLDFGFYQPIKLVGNVYNDINGPTNVDGTPINMPSGMQVYANLVDASGNVVGVATVQPNGTFEFNDVAPNTTYTTQISTNPGVVGNPAPVKNLPFGWSNVSEDCCDNTGNDGTTNGETSVVVGTTDVSNINFGIREPLSVGNSVWIDLDQDGIKDVGEGPIPGAVVKLYRDDNTNGAPDGAAIDSTVTNGSGLYLFDGLNAGSYIVGVTPPTPTTGPNYASSNGVGEESNPNLNIDNNDNGINTVGAETRSGFVTLSVGQEPKLESPSNDATKPDSNSNLTVDFAFYQPIKLAGNVYNDTNGVANVDGTPINNPSGVQLFASLVDPLGNVVDVKPVTPAGTFEFDDVKPNTTYKVITSTTAGVLGNPAPTKNLPFGWSNVSEDCCDNTGNDGTTNSETDVVVGTSNLDNINFGIREPLSLGNSVWIDLNQNGSIDPGEGPIVGASVNLYRDDNNDNVADGGAIATTSTNGSGLYLFDGLDNGSYIVGVTPPAPASGSPYTSSVGAGQETDPNLNGDGNDNGINLVAGETRSNHITLLPGVEPKLENPSNDASKPDSNSNLTLDFGFYQPITLAGNVYNDNDGPANVNGTPINNPSGDDLFANLIDGAGNVIAFDPVNPNGTYEFTDIAPNMTYTVVLTNMPGTVNSPAPTPSLPSDWVNVSEDCCDNTGNDGTANGLLTATVGTMDLTNANFGIREPVALGNLVWIDSNKNGLRDVGELPLLGAQVNLYQDLNGDNIPDGAAVANMTTGANGLYKFEGLEIGKYIVGVTPPAVTGAVYTSSATGEEINPNLDVDNNDNGVTKVGMEMRSNFVDLMPKTEPQGETPNNTGTVPDSNANLTVDFGFFECPNNFTFAPIDLCSGSTINLVALEPAAYKGGTWLLNNTTAVADPTAVPVGSYTYNYTNGDCDASGTVVISPNIPDYTPSITIAPSITIGISNMTVILQINELLNKPACSDVYVLVPKLLPRFTFNYLATATSIGGQAVNNGDWQFFPNANPSFYIWQYTGTGGVYPGNGVSKIGYIGTYDPSNTDGSSTFSVQVFQGSGGETNPNNNTGSSVLQYFR